MNNLPIEQWIKSRSKVILLVFLLLYLILALLSFDTKLSTGGDDSWYLLAAKKFLDGISFPTWHGSLYPIVLSPLVAIMGINVPAFKLLSVFFIALEILLLAAIWRKRIPPFIWFFTIGLAALSFQIIHYSSTTYSEPFFLLIQALVFFSFYQVDQLDINQTPSREILLKLFFFSFCCFLLSITRNIGYGAILAGLFYFLVKGQFKESGLIFLFFLVLTVSFSIYKKLVWQVDSLGVEGQLNHVLYKDFYHPSKGNESFIGLLKRFWENSELYISKHLLKFYGFKSLMSTKTSALTTILLFLLFFGALWQGFKTRKHLLFIAFYLGISMGGTFITQQTAWDQERLVLIYLPLITVLIGTFLYDLIDKNLKAPKLTIFLFVLAIGSMSINAIHTTSKLELATIKRNFSKDPFSAYTPDWNNYLKMCRWASSNLPEKTKIACRKPNIASIYGKGNFAGIYKIPHHTPDSVLQFFQQRNIDYIIVGSLRRIPSKNTGAVITTVRHTLQILLHKYPYILEPIYQIGHSEHAVLFKIHPEEEQLPVDQLINRLKVGLYVAPRNSYAMFLLARLYAGSKDYKNGIKWINKALKIEAKERLYIELRATINWERQAYSEAINDFKLLVKQQPENIIYWNNLTACAQKLDLPEARKYLKTVNQLKNNNKL